MSSHELEVYFENHSDNDVANTPVNNVFVGRGQALPAHPAVICLYHHKYHHLTTLLKCGAKFETKDKAQQMNTYHFFLIKALWLSKPIPYNDKKILINIMAQEAKRYANTEHINDSRHHPNRDPL